MHTFVRLDSVPNIEHAGRRVFNESTARHAKIHWEESRLAKPHLWNGQIVSLAKSCGDILLTEEVDYLYWYFQWVTGTDLGIRPIAVTGILTLEGDVVLARRGPNVTQDATQWELAPSGGLTPAGAIRDVAPSLVGQLVTEAKEELNLDLAPIVSPTLVGLLTDSRTRIFDYAFLCDLSISRSEFTSSFFSRASQEYTDLKLVALEAIQNVNWITETSKYILRSVFPVS